MKVLARLLLSFLLLPGFLHAPARNLDEIKRSGKIYVAFTSDDLNNINYDLAHEFARYLNVELIEVEITWEEAFMLNGTIPEGMKSDDGLSYTPDALKKADIIASTFTMLEWRKKLFGFAQTLQSAELLLVHRDSELPADFQALSGKSLAFMQGTTFEQNLKEISASIQGDIKMVPTSSSQETIGLLEEKRVFGAVFDAEEALNFMAENGQKFQIAFPISEVSRMAWAVEKNNPLIQEVENFFETIASNRILDGFFYRRFGITYTAYLDLLNKSLRLERYQRDLDEILASKKLVVALRERNFIYREGGQKQFMHALAEEFADHLGVDLEFVVTPSFEKYWQAADGQVYRDSSYTPDWFTYFDLACETIAPLDWRTNKVNLVGVYPSAYVLVARKETPIKNISDLKTLKGVTGRETVYEDILKARGMDNYYYEQVNNFASHVREGKADYTLLYNAFYELSDHPDLEIKLELGQLDVCWALRKDQPMLQKELESFMQGSRENGLIAVLMKALKGKTLQSPEAFINSYYESFQTGQMPYVNYGTNDGLPQEDMFSIFQDQKGYIWFGTNSGAVRYNGREMEVFNQEDGLPDHSVRDIAQDSSGCIYFATSNGVGRYLAGAFIDGLMPGESFNDVDIHSSQQVMALGDEGFFMGMPDQEWKHVNRMFQELPSSIYQMLEIPSSGEVLLATILGIYVYDPAASTLEQLTRSDSYSLFLDSNDSIWASSREGLYIAHLDDLLKGKAEDLASSLNQRLQIPNQIISKIVTNKFGSVWLVTDSRIYQVNSTDQKPIVYEQEIGIKNNKILSFLIDQEDNLWIGFSGGLQRLTNRRGLRNFYPGTIDSYIYSVFQDGLTRIWVTSDNGIFYFDQGKLMPYRIPGTPADNKYVGSIAANGNILLASKAGLYEIDVRSLGIREQQEFGALAHPPQNVMLSSKGEVFLLTGIHGAVYYFDGFGSTPRIIKNKYTSNIFQLVEYGGQVIGGNNTGFVYFDQGDFKLLEESSCNIWTLQTEGNRLWVGTDCGLGIVEDGRFDQMELTGLERDLVIKSILPARNRNYLWLGTNRGFSYFNTSSREFDFTINTKDGLRGNEITPGGLFLDHNDLLWVGTYHGISNFNIRAKSNRAFAPVCYIEKMYLNGELIPAVSGRSFSHAENNLVFEISALSFSDESSVEYEYYLRGLSNKYSSYHRGNEYRAFYNNLPPGKYEFIYKAKGKNNIWGYAENYQFSIRKAWYHTWLFRISLVVVLVSLTYLFYLLRIRSIQAQKKRLEEQVRYRTHELEVANTEIEAQRDFARFQRDQIAQQQKSIMDSIHYAQTIQDSLLPDKAYLQDVLPEHFILFKPRDIVSGDFYWVHHEGDLLYLSAADCTGHGVPGAFMSMLGMASLNEILSKDADPGPEEVLNELRELIIETLHQRWDPDAAKDGMDMVLLKYDQVKRALQFAGANNPLYHIRKGELQEYKTNKMPVSIHLAMKPFDRFELELQPGDQVYIFSDGYADQFGGSKGKKLKYRALKEILLKNSSLPMDQQGSLLEKHFDSWKGDVEQVDDVVFIGLRF